MALDFPANPTIGNEYSAGGFTWTWSGSSWDKVASAAVGIPSGETADRPASPAIGDQFYNGTTASLEIYTADGWQSATSSSQSSDFKFNVVLESGESTVTLSTAAPLGAYTISSTSGDTSFDTYLYDANNTRVGYSNSAAITASADFVRITIVGGTVGDLLVFSFAETFSASADSSATDAGAYIDSISTTLIANVNDSITVLGGNFATDVEANFVGTNGVSVPAKSITRVDSTELLVVRPDTWSTAIAPFTLNISNPNVPAPSGSQKHKKSGLSVFSVAGGLEEVANGYKTHTFTSSGTLIVQGDFSNAEVLMVAGGGGGGYQVGGGGGAGGVVYVPVGTIPAGNHTVTIGAGGAGGKQGVRAYNGTNTTIGSIATATGGGGGANHTSSENNTNGTGWPGGSGGAGTGTNNNGSTTGGASTQSTTNLGVPNTGYGNAGGTGVSGSWAGGGGGGAGAPGSNGSGATGGVGGDGISVSISGSQAYYGGGGGGCNGSSAATNAGGQGGGGVGTGNGNPSANKSGSAFTGGGGGGVRDTSGDGGDGGSGIVIVRYPV